MAACIYNWMHLKKSGKKGLGNPCVRDWCMAVVLTAQDAK